MSKYKVYSGWEQIECKSAPDTIVPGCMVLEGGSFRGLYTSGVLDVLMEAGINLQTTIGVSAGALNGFIYACGDIGRSAKINLGHRHDPQYMGLPGLIKNRGVIGFKFLIEDCLKLYPADLDRFNDPSRRFIAVATSLINGKSRYFEKGDCPDIFAALQASASMPYLSRIVKVGKTPCLDGGCSVKVPYQWAMDAGFEKIVIVRTLPREYMRAERKNADSLANVFYKKYPEFVKVLQSSAPRANAETRKINELEKEGRIFVIAPPASIQMHRLEGDMEALGGYYEQGRLDAQNALPDLKKYLDI